MHLAGQEVTKTQSEGGVGGQPYRAMDLDGSPPLASDSRRHDADRTEGSLGGPIDPSTDISKLSKSEREFYKKYGIFKYSFGFGGRGVRPPQESGPVRKPVGDVIFKRRREPSSSSSFVCKKTINAFTKGPNGHGHSG